MRWGTSAGHLSWVTWDEELKSSTMSCPFWVGPCLSTLALVSLLGVGLVLAGGEKRAEEPPSPCPLVERQGAPCSRCNLTSFSSRLTLGGSHPWRVLRGCFELASVSFVIHGLE